MSGSVAVGFRVVRGPAWSWGDQDGGEGYVGTVVEVGQGGRSVVVQWDCGNRCRYRCGEEGKYDLRVFDSAPAGIKHAIIACDWCQVKGLAGSIWRCVRCLDYFLCTTCYMSDKHSLMHQFERIDGKDVKERVLVPWRFNSKKIATRGMFAGAVVIRGHDWRWRDQDGGLGMTGKIVRIIGWQNESTRSVAEVEWTMLPEKRNRYRVGHNGKVDLKCIEAGSGGYYYPEHLPVLGAACEFSGPRDFAAGDVVTVELDLEVLKLLQEGHGGWDDLMLELLGNTGIVNTVLESGDLFIRYPNNRLLMFNPEAVTKANIPSYMPGDIVRVLDDIAKVHELQKAGPGWLDDMVLSLGLVGRVAKRAANGGVLVAVGGRRWAFNPLCLIPAPDADLPNNQDEDELDLNARLQMFSIVSGEDNPDGIAYAAAAGDVNTMVKHLEKFPGEVDRKVLGKAALHVACIDGYIGVLRKLLEYKPDLELLDDNGQSALHICAYVNQEQATEVLLDAGVDVNCRDTMENTPLMIAAAVGHYRILRILATDPQVDLHAQDSNGSTALQCAVIAQRNKSVSILLDAGADPTLVNFTCTSSIHDSCGFGLLPAMEQIVTHFPQCVNFQKDNGYSPLHVAVSNNHPDIAEFLVQQNSCNLNLRTRSDNLTPLHIAVHEGYSVIVEWLVGYGADLNAVSSEGNTVLHLAISRKNMKAPCARTPKLQGIQRNLSEDHKGFKIDPYVIVACFLVQEGGDLHIKNNNGISPLQLCPSDISALISTFVQKYGRGSFHGSLRTYYQSSPVLPVCHQSGKDPKHQSTKAPYSSGLSSGLSSGPTKYKSSNKDVSHTYKGMDKEATDATVPVQDKDADIAQNSAGNVVSGDGEPELCCLCDIPADAKLDPCQHRVMCYHCANKAKRCPTCRVPIQAVTRVQ